ncbi:MAG: tetratricopeptide repeat protein, partial [Armatimonadetes bacterium]|nr:tetratricopeptide repeat protein [Armatimonadota bacterium]
MNKKKMLAVSLISLCFLCTTLLWHAGYGQQTVKSVPPLLKPSKDVEERVKKVYALFIQGQYDEALSIALKVHQQSGNVMVCWYPSWVLRFAKGDLPDPYDKGSILRATVEGSGLPIPISMAVRAKSVRVLIAEIYEEMGNYKEAIKWYEKVGPKLDEEPVGPGIHVSHMGIIRCMQKLNQGYFPPQPPPKTTWSPLSLVYREEDYFILVPLDDACKVLGLPFRYK